MTRGLLRVDKKTEKGMGNPVNMPESTKRETGDEQRKNQGLRTVSG